MELADLIAQAEREFEKYKGQKGMLKRELGEDVAFLLLHKRFKGNAAAAGRFLGYQTYKSVSNQWIKMGLARMGREWQETDMQQGPYPERTTQELWDDYLLLSQEKEEVLEYVWDLPDKVATGKLIPICDIHVGHIGCDFARLAELCDWIRKNPRVRWFLGGDSFDMATKSGPGGKTEQFCSVERALDLLSKALRPIITRGIVVFDGNHEKRLLRAEDVEYSPARQLAQRIDLPFWGMAGHIKHCLDDEVYLHYHHHGRGGARTEGGKLNAGLQILRNVTDELVTLGHLHYEINAKDLSRDPDPDSLTVDNKTRRVALCPSFLQYRGYPSDMAYKPCSLGVSAIDLSRRKHDIKVIQ